VGYFTRRDALRDKNEPEIVRALCRAGATVDRHHEPWDLCVQYKGRTIWMEVKMPLGARGGMGWRKLNAKQQERWDSWQGGELYLVRSPEDALRALGIELERHQ